MKKPFFSWVMVLMIIAVTSCNKSSVNPAGEKKLTTGSAMRNLASNGAVTFNNQIDINLVPYYYDLSSCNGDTLNIVKGIWHFVVHGVTNGDHIMFDQNANIQSYKLVSQSGVVYEGSYDATIHYNIPLVNGAATFTNTYSDRLNTKGGQSNSVYTTVVRETINAQGNLTATVISQTIGCR